MDAQLGAARPQPDEETRRARFHLPSGLDQARHSGPRKLAGSGHTRFRCNGYRFDDVYVRRHGNIAVFATRMTLDAAMGDHDWSGETWLMDLWQKSKVRRKWRIVERTISRPDTDAKMPEAIRSMQLWR